MELETRTQACPGHTHSTCNMLNQLSCIPLPTAAWLCSEIDQVPAVGVPVAHDFLLGHMQQGQEFVEKSLLAFGAELEIQPPHSAAEDGEPIVQVLSRRHPQRDTIVVVADGGHQPFDTVCVSHILHGLSMKVKALRFGPVSTVRGIDRVSNNMVVGKGVGETLCSGLVLRRWHDANLRFHRSGC